MPHALIAAISLSAERREKTSTLETRSASGIVHCNVSGKLTMANFPTRDGAIPSSMKPTIWTRSPMGSTNVSTSADSAKLDRNAPNTYLSIVFIQIL